MLLLSLQRSQLGDSELIKGSSKNQKPQVVKIYSKF